MQRWGVEAAIDEHDEPFYGKSEELLEYTCGSRAKAGTTHFFRLISLYVIYRQMRLTVAVAFVHPEEDTVAIVQKLLTRSRELKLRLDVLYLDRGFCTTPVIAHLQLLKQPAVLVCPIRGKEGGTRPLCRGRKSYRIHYTFTSALTVEMPVVATLVPGKDKKRRRKWLLFVLVGLDWQPATVYRRYPGAPGRALASSPLIAFCAAFASKPLRATRPYVSFSWALPYFWSICGRCCAGVLLAFLVLAHIALTPFFSSSRPLSACFVALSSSFTVLSCPFLSLFLPNRELLTYILPKISYKSSEWANLSDASLTL